MAIYLGLRSSKGFIRDERNQMFTDMQITQDGFMDMQITATECDFSNKISQVLGKVPTVSIDKTDGCQIYLSPESLDVEIVSSKSSEMNVLVPEGNGDYSEHPVPEQFKTVLNKAKNGITTTPVESTG